jgi:hypothetical protein
MVQGEWIQKMKTERFARVGRFPVLMTLVALLAGCATSPRLSPVERTAIQDRANIRFQETVLIKPEESDRPAFRLGPLLLQEVNSADDPADAPYSVYFWRTRARGMGTVLTQFNYLWFHDREEGEESRKIPQGVRITFTPDGKPILWEVLREPGGVRVFFVSQSLEEYAMTNFPAPYDGRRFWVERSTAETPGVVVARILDDGPEPMGPIIYLAADTQDVATVICRCMDAQAEEVVGMGTYGLALLNDAAVRWLNADPTRDITRWLPGKPPDELDQLLRLPQP